MKKEAGITLVSLVVTILVLLILAGTVTVSGINAIEKAKKTSFISELEMIQAKVNTIYEKRKLSQEAADYYNRLGQDISILGQDKVNEIFKGNSSDGFRYFTKEDLKQIEIEDISQEVVINFQTREVISVRGIQIGNTKYYRLKEIPNYTGHNIDYVAKNNTRPTFKVEVDKRENTWQVTLQDIIYTSNVSSGTVSYKKYGASNWILLGDKTIFEVDSAGLYQIRLTDKAKNSTTIEKFIPYSYTTEGLLVYYDAESNIQDGHSDTVATWKDLSGNNNDAVLKGATPTWEANCYSFEGSNANYFETTKELVLGTKDRTIEFVISASNTNLQNIFGLGTTDVANMFDCLIYNGGFNCHVFGNGAKEGIEEGITSDKIYSNTWRYTNSQMSYKTNESTKNGVSFYPLNTSTSKLLLGIGKYEQYNSNNPFKIYAIRIYDRRLTEEEIQNNYAIDKIRFGI